MPADQQGQVYKTGRGFGLRWCDETGRRRRQAGFSSPPAVVFASETGMRPSEWLAIEWRDVDRKAGVVLVERTCAYGVTKAYGKTTRSRRRVPLTTRAIEALDAVPRRLDVRLFPGKRGGVIDLTNFRRSQWTPSLEAAGIPQRRIYDMRHSFATWSLDAGSRFRACPLHGNVRQHD